MKPREINDFIPLQILSTDILEKVKSKWQIERDKIPESNRIYFFSKALEVRTVRSSFFNHLM